MSVNNVSRESASGALSRWPYWSITVGEQANEYDANEAVTNYATPAIDGGVDAGGFAGLDYEGLDLFENPAAKLAAVQEMLITINSVARARTTLRSWLINK